MSRIGPKPQSLPFTVSVAVGFSLLSSSVVFAQAPNPSTQLASTTVGRSAETVNTDIMARIREEGMNRSQVMSTLMYLTDVIGPRVTASPGLKRANLWTKSKLSEWGLENAHLEPWGPFGRGWSVEKFSAQVVEPQCIPLIALPKAWSPSVKGTKTCEVVYLDATDEAGLEKYKGKLKDKIVLISPIRPVTAHFKAEGNRYTDAELAEMASPPAPRVPGEGGRRNFNPQMMQSMMMGRTKLRFCQDEGAAVVLDSGRGDGGTLFVQQMTVPPARTATRPATPPAGAPPTGAPTGAPPAGGPPPGIFGGGPRSVSPWSKDLPKDVVPQITVSSEHYNRLVRMVQAGEKVQIAVELKTKYHDEDNGMVYNTVAEIPGTDKKDEIVMCGGHMDSWHGATGATDNGAGVAVSMEAVRILKALGLPLRRTVRVALWSGEEQGLYGSQAYVKEHFGERKDGKLVTKPEHEKLAGYFNLDNGTGKIRGVYCQGNAEVAPIFAEWLKPFNDLGATTITLRNTGGTDHLSFDGVGLPGFQFVQDTIEYDSRTHHSNQDNFDRIQEEDMKQAATIMAAFLYNAATRDEKLPRKPEPVPTTAQR